MKQETNITWSNRGFHNYEATYKGERVAYISPTFGNISKKGRYNVLLLKKNTRHYCETHAEAREFVALSMEAEDHVK